MGKGEKKNSVCVGGNHQQIICTYVGSGDEGKDKEKIGWPTSLSCAHPLGGKFTSYKEFPSCAGGERTPKTLKVFSLIHKLLLVVSVSFSLTTRDRRD